MAETAPNATGQSATTEGAPGTPGGEPEVKTFTQEQVEAIVSHRLRKLKGELSTVQTRVAELERKPAAASGNSDDDDEPATPANPAAQATTAAQPDPGKRWREKLAAQGVEFAKQKSELEAKISEIDRAHKTTLIKTSLTEELNKRTNVRQTSVPKILTLVAGDFDLADGATVPKGDDVTSVAEYFDKYLAANPEFMQAPVTGDGAKPGRLPGTSRKTVGEMNQQEAAAAAVGKLFGKP
jgi:hypothetical protein